MKNAHSFFCLYLTMPEHFSFQLFYFEVRSLMCAPIFFVFRWMPLLLLPIAQAGKGAAEKKSAGASSKTGAAEAAWVDLWPGPVPRGAGAAATDVAAAFLTLVVELKEPRLAQGQQNLAAALAVALGVDARAVAVTDLRPVGAGLEGAPTAAVVEAQVMASVGTAAQAARAAQSLVARAAGATPGADGVAVRLGRDLGCGECEVRQPISVAVVRGPAALERLTSLGLDVRPLEQALEQATGLGPILPGLVAIKPRPDQATAAGWEAPFSGSSRSRGHRRGTVRAPGKNDGVASLSWASLLDLAETEDAAHHTKRPSALSVEELLTGMVSGTRAVSSGVSAAALGAPVDGLGAHPLSEDAFRFHLLQQNWHQGMQHQLMQHQLMQHQLQEQHLRAQQAQQQQPLPSLATVAATQAATSAAMLAMSPTLFSSGPFFGAHLSNFQGAEFSSATMASSAPSVAGGGENGGSAALLTNMRLQREAAEVQLKYLQVCQMLQTKETPIFKCAP